MEEPRFLSGKLLLAMPGMADPRFERAVIALCVHDENGAVGIGIGQKRAGMRFRALLQQLEGAPVVFEPSPGLASVTAVDASASDLHPDLGVPSS